MTYETIDWDAEAKRVAEAFEIGLPSWFESTKNGTVHKLVLESDFYYPLHCGISGQKILVRYGPEGMVFQYVYKIQAWIGSMDLRGIKLTWDKRVHNGCTFDHAESMCKGLFRLGLLTPEVEAALGVTITAHQKIEWEIEYQGRGGG